MDSPFRKAVTRRFQVAVSLLLIGLSSCSSNEHQQVPVPASIVAKSSDQDAANLSPTATHAENPAAGDRLPPTVLIKTSHGDITVKLSPLESPATVDNFLNNYVARGHYERTIFHYIDPGRVVLGGGFTEGGELKATRAQITNEADNGLLNRRGTIAMARDPDYVHSATCQFFFNLSDNPAFDHTGRESPEAYGYCVFGEVIDGMEVLDKIAKTEVHDTPEFPSYPKTPAVIHSVRRLK